VENGELLQIAAGVTLVGQEGVVLSCYHARLEVRTEGARILSVDFPHGVRVISGGSLTMTKCTSTGEQIGVEEGASLVMEDSRVFASSGQGVYCTGDLQMTRCTVESNALSGVDVFGRQASAELVDCVIRKNTSSVMYVHAGTAVLRGGSVSENNRHGVGAWGCGKVAVAKAEEGKPQTVSKDDWATAR